MNRTTPWPDSERAELIHALPEFQGPYWRARLAKKLSKDFHRRITPEAVERQVRLIHQQGRLIETSRGRHWTQDEIDALIKLRKKGLGFREVAEELTVMFGREFTESSASNKWCHVERWRAPKARSRRRNPATITSKDEVQTRDCLRCQRPFRSSWSGNRICTPCRALSDSFYEGWDA